jgi:hypothetical protein
VHSGASDNRRPSGPKPETAAELKAQLEVERTGRPFFSYRDDSGTHRLLAIESEDAEIWIGRGAQADLRLEWDKEASALHAQVVVVRGVCTLVDEGLSTNGTYVNSERVSGRRRLRDHDLIRVGGTSLLFRSTPSRDETTTLSYADDALALVRVSPAQARVLVELCRPFKGGPAFATPATNQQIADRLHLSVDAVKTHLRALFEKFELGELPQNQKRVALVERAMQTGLIDERDL